MCFFTKSSEKFLEMHNDICIVNFNFTQSYNSIKVVCVDIIRITWPVKDLKGSAVNHTFQLVNGIEDIITEKKKLSSITLSWFISWCRKPTLQHRGMPFCNRSVVTQQSC